MSGNILDDHVLEGRRVVMACGVSGSGKTRLSRRLAGLGFVRVSADELLWERFGDAFPSLPEEERREAFAEVSGRVESEVDRLLGDGRRVVVDATFCRRAKRDRMRGICARHGVEPLLVFLDPPLPLLRERLSRRKGDGCDDQIVTPAQLEAFHSNFERPGDDEDFFSCESEG